MNRLRQIFNPSLEDKIKFKISYLKWWIEFLENKSCISCKYSEPRLDYMHEYETTVTYCNKHNKYCPSSCEDYDLENLVVEKNLNKDKIIEKMAEFIKKTCNYKTHPHCQTVLWDYYFGDSKPCDMEVEDIIKIFKEK